MKEASEECDDGNMNEGDGCTPGCLVEHPEVCPGAAIHIAKGQTVTVSGTTANATDKFIGTPSNVTGNCMNSNWFGPDLVYGVIPAVDGTLKAALTSVYDDPMVHIRTACPGAKQDEVACQTSFNVGLVTISKSVTAGTTYYVAADTWNNKSGSFTMDLSLQ